VRYWNTKRQCFPPECEGFSLNNAYGLPNQGFSAGFAPKGTCFLVFDSSKFPNAFKENKARSCKHGEIITVQAWELKVPYLLPIIKHP
jgi:hypothetical protein